VKHVISLLALVTLVLVAGPVAQRGAVTPARPAPAGGDRAAREADQVLTYPPGGERV